eukprot:12929331-Prorocentrum_lima.AAC.1
MAHVSPALFPAYTKTCLVQFHPPECMGLSSLLVWPYGRKLGPRHESCIGLQLLWFLEYEQ